MYFNPRTRVGCDLVKIGLPIILSVISIHAPAWGATLHHSLHVRSLRISIHAPAWGATTRLFK